MCYACSIICAEIKVGYLIGYVRVSAVIQSLDTQRAQLVEHRCVRLFEEKASCAKRDRPELSRMLDHLREGDILLVIRPDRLARSKSDLLQIAESLSDRGQAFVHWQSHGRILRLQRGA